MQIRPKVLLDYGRINEPLQIPISDLLLNPTYQTFLNADTASGVSSLTVKNITGFAINQILLIGEPGQQGSEIIKTSASVAPTGSTITLAASTVFPHSAGTKIYVILFDQVELSHSVSVSGSKTVMSTPNIVASNPTTNYNDTTYSSGYYYARFKNSISAGFSSYSDPAPYDGYTMFSARAIIDKALGAINKNTSQVLSDQFAFSEIDNCQMECLREYKRWSFMQSFNTILDLTKENQLRIALPADCDDQQTTKSVWNFRISRYPDMIWVDKSEWDALMQTICYTTLATSISLNDVSIVLTNSGDFTDTGSVKIGSNVYAFTANNKTTNTLTIAASTTTNTAGEDVTEFGSPGLPQFYTVWNGYIYFFPQIAPEYKNFNYYLDYYKKLTQIQHDSDLIVLPDPTVVQYFLEWKFLKKLNNGEENDSSLAAQKNYEIRREKMKQKEWFNRKFIWQPYDLV